MLPEHAWRIPANRPTYPQSPQVPQSVEARYNQTLERLLAPRSEVRQAAVLALGMIGFDAVNASSPPGCTTKTPPRGRLAADALWSIWYRADSPENNRTATAHATSPWMTKPPKTCWPAFDALIRKSAALCRGVSTSGPSSTFRPATMPSHRRLRKNAAAQSRTTSAPPAAWANAS